MSTWFLDSELSTCLDKMLKMVKTMAKALVKTMGKTTTEIDLMIARFFMYTLYIHFNDYILLYISFTIQFSHNIIMLNKNSLEAVKKGRSQVKQKQLA